MREESAVTVPDPCRILRTDEGGTGKLYIREKTSNYYSLVLFPEGDTGAEVKFLAEHLQEMFPNELRVLFKPFIELAFFEAREEMEETLIRWIQRICNVESRFVVTLNNFGSLPPDTLYLRILDHQPFFRLMNKLKVIESYIESNGHGKVVWPTRPICKLAAQLNKGLQPGQIMTQAKLEYHAQFTAYNLVLLKMESGQKEPSVVNVFPLYP